VVRPVDAIGKTDESLSAITVTGRITNAPSTSGFHGPICISSTLAQCTELLVATLIQATSLATPRHHRRFR
jgi:hypothetical protein